MFENPQTEEELKLKKVEKLQPSDKLKQKLSKLVFYLLFNDCIKFGLFWTIFLKSIYNFEIDPLLI